MAQKTGAGTSWHMVFWTVARVQILLYRMGEEHMRLSIKLFDHRYVLKIYFPPERYIKWLPAIFWAKVGRPIRPEGNNT